jgi:hypothetical protein
MRWDRTKVAAYCFPAAKLAGMAFDIPVLQQFQIVHCADDT